MNNHKRIRTERNLVNIFFLIAAAAIVCVNFLPSAVLQRIAASNMFFGTAISELMILIPALLMLLIWYFTQMKWESEDADYTAVKISDRLMYRSVRPASVLMTFLYTLTISPLVTLCNLITTLFVDNTVLEYSTDIIDMSFPVAVITIAILPPLCEEFIFRGFVYGGYRRACRPAGAIFMSAFLFGLIHGNINQFAYAFLIGISMALLAEATGSIWPTVLMHFLINIRSVIAMYLLEHIQNGFFEKYLESGVPVDIGSSLITIAIYAVLSVLTTLMAGAILSWIAGNEGRSNPLKTLVAGKTFRATRLTVFSVPLLIGIIIMIAYMIELEVLSAIQ